MRTGVVAKRCSCGSFWRNGVRSCTRCGSSRFASWGFYVDTHPRGATERRKTVRSGFATKDAAERDLLNLLEAVETGTYIPPSKLTLERYLPSWLEGRTHLRPTTRDTYGILIERYVCNPDYGIGTAPLWSLTRPGNRRFYTELERRGRIRGDGPMTPKSRAQRPPPPAQGPRGRHGRRPHPREPGPPCPQAGRSPPRDEDVDGGPGGLVPRLGTGAPARCSLANRSDHWDATRRASRPHVARSRYGCSQAPRDPGPGERTERRTAAVRSPEDRSRPEGRAARPRDGPNAAGSPPPSAPGA